MRTKARCCFALVRRCEEHAFKAGQQHDTHCFLRVVALAAFLSVMVGIPVSRGIVWNAHSTGNCFGRYGTMRNARTLAVVALCCGCCSKLILTPGMLLAPPPYLSQSHHHIVQKPDALPLELICAATVGPILAVHRLQGNLLGQEQRPLSLRRSLDMVLQQQHRQHTADIVRHGVDMVL